MGLEKAKLRPEKGSSLSDLTVRFNPAEYNLQSSVNYAEKNIPGLGGPIRQFISKASSSLSMTLIFDTYEPPTLDNPQEGGQDVSKKTRKVMEMTQIISSLHRPPLVTFIWGSLSFTGIISDMKQTYTMFLPTGMPVRARVEITFKAVYDMETDKKGIPFESPDRTKVALLKEGEQLWQYASREYDDPGKWRLIAEANKILNPLELVKGQHLKLPAE